MIMLIIINGSNRGTIKSNKLMAIIGTIIGTIIIIIIIIIVR